MNHVLFFIKLIISLLLTFPTASGIPCSSARSPLSPVLRPKIGRGTVGQQCFSISDCNAGFVCTVGNPLGTCQRPISIEGVGHLTANIIQLDYTPPAGSRDPSPEHGGPTRTSRAMAIIFFSAHDAYALCTNRFDPKIKGRTQERLRQVAEQVVRELRMPFRNPSNSNALVQRQCRLASLSAAYFAARRLYPRFDEAISIVQRGGTSGVRAEPQYFGQQVADAWVSSRSADGSNRDQLDDIFTFEAPLHQPDPNFNIVTNETGTQPNFGRFWGAVTPFVIRNVTRDAFLAPPPALGSQEYRSNLTEVRETGQCNNMTFSDDLLLNELGTFWGYDGMPEIGVPPRLYLQVVLAVPELYKLSFENQLRALTAVNGAMADAGIAAWFWKFEYDLWRPTLGIRRDTVEPDTDWSPFGVPFSNINPDTVPKCVGLNPDFPAYPSGHSTFGTAAFQTLANVLGMAPQAVSLNFTSDEFNGVTIDGFTNEPRRVVTQTLTLEDCIQQNQDSRVFNGVHWRFDSIGGDIVGSQIAYRAAREFALIPGGDDGDGSLL